MRSKAQLEEVIRRHTHPEYQAELLQSIRPYIRLKTRTAQVFQVGITKFGGQPDLPEGMKWPKGEGQVPYTFISQINLSELNSYDLENSLPKEGMLYFFLNYSNFHDACVLYSPKVDTLSARAIPSALEKEHKNWFQQLFGLKGQKHLVNECGVEVSTEYIIPTTESLYFKRILKEKGHQKAPRVYNEEIYEEGLLYEEDETDTTSNHHLLGHYHAIQHEYQELQLIHSKTKIEELSMEEINRALEWKLLFQLDSDRNLNLNIGDWGKIYFFIHEADLNNYDFERVKVIWECY